MKRVALATIFAVGGVLIAPQVWTEQTVDAHARMEQDPGRPPTFAFAGDTPVESDEDRFGREVDLVIETSEQYEVHEDQIAEHPEWFEDVTIGVSDGALADVERADRTEARQEQSTMSSLESEEAETEGAIQCSRNRGAVPTSTAAGRWLLCSGSGNGAAYFVASAAQPGDAPFLTLQANVASLSATPAADSSLGYFSELESSQGLVQAVSEPTSGRVVIDLNPSVSGMVGTTGTALLGLQEQLLRSVLMYQNSATLILTIGGNCAAYAALAEVAATCDGLTAADVQPRTGW